MQVETISAAKLTKKLESSCKKILILDCRSFQMFNKDNIRGSVNAFCPPILKRRIEKTGFIRLEAVVKPDIRKKLRSGDYNELVLYDESDSSKDMSDINILLQGLQTYSYMMRSAFVLKGGFSQFRTKYPQFCEQNKSTTSEDKDIPASLPSLSTLHMQNPPTKLLPHLYIGDEFHSTNTDLLHRVGITAILNVSASCPIPPSSEKFIYKRIPLRDNETENISRWFSDALHFIDTVRRQGGKTLVHCKAGISRSATICIAYLMVHKALTLDQAFTFVQSRREIISPNMSFMQQLFEFERVLLMTNFSTYLMTSSPTLPPLTCAQTSEMSPNIKMGTQFSFNVCAISNP